MSNNDWDEILSAAARLQGQVREAVLVGGTAAALFAHHRTSYDADHVVVDLKNQFDEILADLESVAGWKTARIKRPVLILGSLDGIETGIRQLIRSEPLETIELYAKGQKITVPTENEILRIKGALILKRNATRDYLDFAALSKHMGVPQTIKALENFDSLYPQPNGASAIQQLCIQLASPSPYDREAVDFTNYKNLQPFWQKWDNVLSQCQEVCFSIFASLPRTQNMNVNDQQKTEACMSTEQNVDRSYEQMRSLNFKWALPADGLHILKAENTRAALFTFHKYRVEHVSDTLRTFERIESTYAQTRTILDGKTVDGLTTKQLRTIENYGLACEKLSDLIENNQFRFSKDIICQIHSLLAKDEALDVGMFRSHAVAIERSCYTPPRSEYLDGIFTEGASFLNSIENVQERAVCTFLFLSRSQFFSDCNKRTANLIMNGILLQDGYQPLTLNGAHFLEKIAEFYESADATNIIKTIDDIARQQYVTREAKPTIQEELSKLVANKNKQIERIDSKLSSLIRSQEKLIQKTAHQRPGVLSYLFHGNQWKKQLQEQQGRLEQLVKRRERLELLKNGVGQKRVEAMVMRQLGLVNMHMPQPKHELPSVQNSHQGRGHSLSKRISR